MSFFSATSFLAHGSSHNSGDSVAEAETDTWENYFRDYIAPSEQSKEPVCDIAYPIIDEVTISDVFSQDDSRPSNYAVVGILGASMYWRTTIRSILPKGCNGINIVFRNSCTEPFTYQIQGPDVEYLGVGDLHDNRYDDLAEHWDLQDLFASDESTYYGAQLDNDLCPMTLSIYASQTMERTYTSNNPVIFTVAAVVIFAFSSLLFFLYDLKVERRQETV